MAIETRPLGQTGTDVTILGYGADAQAQVANRAQAARTGIPATLAALKQAAESP